MTSPSQTSFRGKSLKGVLRHAAEVGLDKLARGAESLCFRAEH